MKKYNYMPKVLLFVFALISFFSCKPKTPKPVTPNIAKTWTATKVVEGSTVVYEKGATNNIVPGYSNYTLTLSSGSSATLKEFNGTTFTATYTATNGVLTLSSLNPQPTGLTNLSYNYVVNSAGTQMTLTANFEYPKTGQTKNVYTLQAQ